MIYWEGNCELFLSVYKFHNSFCRCIWLGDSDIDDKDMAIDPLVDAMNTSGDRLSTLVIMISIMLSIPDNMQMLIESGAVLSPPVAFTWLMHAVVSKNFFVGLLILDNLSHWMRKNAEVIRICF